MPPATKTTTPTRGDDVAAVKDLVAWLRMSGLALSALRVGDIELHISTPARLPVLNLDDAAASATNIYEQYGGDALKELQRLQVSEIDDDDQPAVSS